MALSETEVVDAALAILDTYGLADLTMRRLGDALGVRAGALYHHVDNKQGLLALLADRILGEVPDDQGQWRGALAGWASGLRAALLRHRDSAEVVASVRAMGLGTVDAVTHPVSVLRAAGLSDAQAAPAASALLHFVLGHVAEEHARADWEKFGRPAPGERPRSDARSFELGVGLLVDGIGVRFSLL